MKMSKELFDELSMLESAYINEDGKEVLNPKTMFLPGHEDPLSIKEQIQKLVRVELSRQAEAQGKESFEQANDFDVDDEDAEPLTPYELNDNNIPIMQEEIRQIQDEINILKQENIKPEEQMKDDNPESVSEEKEEETTTLT